eukprot:4956268-Pleurochrysis_carterae.AAC.1
MQASDRFGWVGESENWARALVVGCVSVEAKAMKSLGVRRVRARVAPANATRACLRAGAGACTEGAWE